MTIDPILIENTKSEIKRLKSQRKRMASDLIEFKRRSFLQRIEDLDEYICKAESVLDKYMKDGTGYYFLVRFTGYRSGNPQPYFPKTSISSETNNKKPLTREEQMALEKQRKKIRNEKLTDDIFGYGAIIVFLLIVAFISWIIIAFFSDTPFGTDYGFGIKLFICLVIVIIVCFGKR